MNLFKSRRRLAALLTGIGLAAGVALGCSAPEQSEPAERQPPAAVLADRPGSVPAAPAAQQAPAAAKEAPSAQTATPTTKEAASEQTAPAAQVAPPAAKDATSAETEPAATAMATSPSGETASTESQKGATESVSQEAPQTDESSQQPTEGSASPSGGESSAPIAPTHPAADSRPDDTYDIEFEGKRYTLWQATSKDGIPAVFNPGFISAQEGDDFVSNGDMVIGLSINGDHRAYPVPYMSTREIVNDFVGGKPVAITW